MIDKHLAPLSRRTALLLLAAILAVGFGLRVWNVNFDRGIGSHPDERSTACFYAPGLRLPASFEEFWDPHRSPLNPLWDLNRQERRSFTYGHFPLYLGVLTGNALHQLAPVAGAAGLPDDTVALMQRANTSCDAIAVAGRLTIAALDTLTILLLYLFGGLLVGRRTGLLAAAFYAFTAQAIQLSHFFAMDPASTTFTVLAVYAGVRMTRSPRRREAILAGVGVGLAVASKFSALPLLAIPLVAALLAVWREYQASHAAGRPIDARTQFAAVSNVLLAWSVAFAAFFVTSPYAVLDWRNFVQATLVEQGMMVRGVADMPFTRQYRNTAPYLYFLQEQLQWGLGWALGLVAALGVGYAALELVRAFYRIGYCGVMAARRQAARKWLNDEQIANLVVWAWVIPYFGLTGAFLAKFNRYMSPLLPFALLWAAWMISVLWRMNARRGTGNAEEAPRPAPFDDQIVNSELSIENSEVGAAPHPLTPSPSRPSRPARYAAIAIALLGLVGGAFWSLAYVNGVYNREHTWITASRWIYENAPRDSVLLWELWDDPLPKSIPGEPGMDMGTTGLRNIDWSPYEEDTAEKYEILKQKLREADFVVYSSKRIYDSVDELPQRYPMTTLYYDAMFDGRLGFELAGEFTSPPSFLGFTFDDRHADESWSLYDHPQVSVFRKVRDLSDAEFDALFGRAWERAIPYYRGQDSPLSPFLNFIGLGAAPGTESTGLLNAIIGVFSGEPRSPVPPVEARRSLMLPAPLRELPVVDNYRWNVAASESTPLAILWWWGVLALLGWLVWPLAFYVFAPLRDRGYFIARTLGWLLASWLLWMLVSLGLLQNLVVHAWLSVALLAAAGIAAAVVQRRALAAYIRQNWGVLLVGEAVFGAAFLFFVYIRMLNPDLWQPWFGGEKQMEFAFLNGILRSPTFPPVNPHFAGGVINYYYFGLYMVAYLVKLTGIYAEVAFNLTIAMLFALTVVNSFGVAYSAVKGHAPLSRGSPRLAWQAGLGAALLAPLFVVIIGNLDGFAQVVRNLANLAPGDFQSSLPGLKTLVDAGAGLQKVLADQAMLPDYDFWGPSRVILPTINEFPYWSFLFADLHPHIIGIPLAGMFLALVLVLIEDAGTDWRVRWRYGLALLATFALFLGAMASVNLWELPTYFGLGVLAFLVSQFRGRGRIDWLLTIGAAVVYGLGAFALFAPFFLNYVNVGASGIGLLREPDPPEQWLLVWAFPAFLFVSWTLFTASRAARPALTGAGERVQPAGVERATAIGLRRFDLLPRVVYLHQRLVQQPTFTYLLLVGLIPLTLLLALGALLLGWVVLALCLAPLGFAVAILWRRGREADAGSLFAAMLGATGLALLAGTQVFYLRDFLDGSDYYRMNTLFKFFNQVWVLWGIMGAIAVPRIFDEFVAGGRDSGLASARNRVSMGRRITRGGWAIAFTLLLAASLAYPLLGTPARLDQRMPGWRPEIGTLNGMDFMRQGVYAWPDFNNTIELSYEYDAIQWLLQNVRGNATVLESAEVDYYRAWGTRVASNTGLSGLKGMHEQEQRYPEDVGYRDGLMRELWTNPDIARTQQIIDELAIDLVYIGQLERYLHPDGVTKFAQMAAEGALTPVYQNDRVIIYAVPGRLAL